MMVDSSVSIIECEIVYPWKSLDLKDANTSNFHSFVTTIIVNN